MIHVKSASCALVAACLLSACATGSELDRGAAFNACKSSGASDMSACVDQKMADRSADRLAYAERYQEDLQACEDRQTMAAARGAGADQISCSSNLADYALSSSD